MSFLLISLSSVRTANVTGVDVKQARTDESYKREDIQGLRAIAVLGVILFHADLPVPGGFAGVDVFFAISGFVITQLLVRQLEAKGGYSLVWFFWRRTTRLLPALAGMVFVVLLASIFLLSPFGTQEIAARTGIGAVLLCANVVIALSLGGYFDFDAITNPLLNTWSLSVEEQFYILFPVLLLFIWKTRRSLLHWRKVALGTLLLATTVSFLLAVVGSWQITFQGSQYLLGFYSPITRAWEFGVGALVALWIPHMRHLSRRASTWVGITGLLFIFSSYFLLSGSLPYPGVWTLLPVTGTLLVIIAGHARSPAAPTKIIQVKPLSLVGDLSYSLYLWHWPTIVFAFILFERSPTVGLIAAFASLIPSVLSYRYIENRWRRHPLTTWRRIWKFIGVCTVPVFSLSLLILLGNQKYWWSQEVQFMTNSIQPMHAASTQLCLLEDRGNTNPEGTCTWNSDGAGPPVYLVGDSHAGQFIEGMSQATEIRDRPLTLIMRVGCTFSPVFADSNLDRLVSSQCSSFVESTLSGLLRSKPGTVILANADVRWRSDVHSATTVTDRAEEYEEWLTDAIDALTGIGHEVYVVEPIPRWVSSTKTIWEPSTCTLLSVLEDSCRAKTSLEALQSPQLRLINALNKVTARTNADLVSVNEALCPLGVCDTHSPQYTRYRDSSHISTAQSKALASRFAPLL